jgi:hypothetical protein
MQCYFIFISPFTQWQIVSNFNVMCATDVINHNFKYSIKIQFFPTVKRRIINFIKHIDPSLLWKRAHLIIKWTVLWWDGWDKKSGFEQNKCRCRCAHSWQRIRSYINEILHRESRLAAAPWVTNVWPHTPNHSPQAKVMTCRNLG